MSSDRGRSIELPGEGDDMPDEKATRVTTREPAMVEVEQPSLDNPKQPGVLQTPFVEGRTPEAVKLPVRKRDPIRERMQDAG